MAQQPSFQHLALQSSDVSTETFEFMNPALAHIVERRNSEKVSMAEHEPAHQRPAFEESEVEDFSSFSQTSSHIHARELDFGEFSVLGQGAVGVVYKAKFNNIPVAVKVLKDDAKLDSDFSIAAADFKQELSVVSILPNHPNIVSFLGASVAENDQGDILPMLIFEVVGGGSIDRLFRTKSLGASQWKPPPALALSWCHQLSLAVEFLHTCETPVAHRDIKLANLLVSEDLQTLKIADFSLALHLHQEELGDCAGSLRFMAPEVHSLKGKSSYALDKADIYSAAITMWCLLHGSCPFPAMHDSQSVPPAIRFGVRPFIKRDHWGMRHVLQQGWHEDPLQRPDALEIAAQTAQALKKFQRKPWSSLKDLFSTKK